MVSSITSTSTTLSELQSLLKAANTDGDGVVSTEELQTALSESDTAAALVSEADSDGDGAMSLQEFSSFATQFSGATGLVLISAQEESGLASNFAKLDRDGDATLTGAEIVASIATLATQAEEDAAAAEAEAETASESIVTTIGAADGEDEYVASDDVQELIDSVDTNKDGVFDSKDIAALILDADQNASSSDDDETSLTEDLLQSVYATESDDEDSATNS